MRIRSAAGSAGLGTALTALAVTLSLTATGTPARGTETTSAAPARTATPMSATYTCPYNTLKALDAVCGVANVPVDHSKPKGKQMTLALSVVKATAPRDQYQGLLIINPGGPGSGGLATSASMAGLLPKDVAASYDIVGFDPRGVDKSNPRMSCDNNFVYGPKPDYTPTTGLKKAVSKPEKAWLKDTKKYAAACKAKYGELLENMTSMDTVRDIDLIRRGFLADKISFYGFSWGSYLAQLYASTFPGRTYRMVLDAVTDPSTIWFAGTKARPGYLEVVIDKFWAWTARNHKTYGLGKTAAKVEALYYRELAKLRKKPVGRVGPAEWTDTFHQPAYGWTTWARTAASLRSWVEGDKAPMTAQWRSRGGGNDNFTAVYLSTQCSDATWPREYKVVRTSGFASAAKSPFAAWHTTMRTAVACLSWPVKGGKAPKVDGKKAPAILLVSSTVDPATPYPGALVARKLFPKSRLVSDPTPKHGVSLAGNACVDKYVAAYLRNGELPARKSGSRADATCKKRPDPKP